MKYDFDATGVTISGNECTDHTVKPINEEFATYAKLASMDLWWFNQEGRKSKATLTELNSTARFCDSDDEYTPGKECDPNDTFYVKFEYLPAGKNWDQGLLIRTKMDRFGNKTSDGSDIMQKVG